MSAEIYYFSGTGNSLVVARDIAGKINAKLTSIASLINKNSIDTEAKIIGFVFPIYDFKQPKLVVDFIKKFKDIKSKYIFAVCTYGILPSKAVIIFDKLIRSCGGELSAGFAVKMPHNGIGSVLFSQAQIDAMFKNWKIKLEEVGKYIIDRKKGKLETSNMFFGLVLSGLFFKMIPTIFKLLKLVITKGWKSLALISNEKCNGCGVCKKICPVDNIEMIDNKPVWSDRCAGCMACFHWCPKEAIRIGYTNMNIKRYHHPEVKIDDMITQAE